MLNKQINSAHRSANYLDPMNLQKRIDLLRRNKILIFLKQNTAHSKHAVVENELYSLCKKNGILRLHMDAWQNVKNKVLF